MKPLERQRITIQKQLKNTYNKQPTKINRPVNILKNHYESKTNTNPKKHFKAFRQPVNTTRNNTPKNISVKKGFEKTCYIL